MRMIRTYPQPDSPEPHLGSRERALAVFKYLLDLEPEDAVRHPMFACVVHAFEQHATREYLISEESGCSAEDLEPSLVPMLPKSERILDADAKRYVADEGKL